MEQADCERLYLAARDKVMSQVGQGWSALPLEHRVAMIHITAVDLHLSETDPEVDRSFVVDLALHVGSRCAQDLTTVSGSGS